MSFALKLKKYHPRDPKQKAKHDKQYYKIHREQILRQKKNSYNPKAERSKAGKYIQYWKEQAFNRIGRTCKNCGFSDLRALQFDHIHGGGSKAMRKLKTRGRAWYYRKIALAPKMEKVFQILCANCNWIKRVEQLEENRQART